MKNIHILFIFLLSYTVVLSQQNYNTQRGGIEIIKDFEGFRSRAYRCPANVWTIGYGNTSKAKPGMVITKEQGEIFLQEDLRRFEKHVNNNINRQTLLFNEFDALVSFSFNLGYRVTGLLAKSVNENNSLEVTKRIKLYNKARVNGVLTVLSGLTRRRVAESNLYLKNGKYIGFYNEKFHPDDYNKIIPIITYSQYYKLEPEYVLAQFRSSLYQFNVPLYLAMK